MPHNQKHAINSTNDHLGIEGMPEGNIYIANANGIPSDSGYHYWKTISYTTADQTIYVSPSGSDENGDGTEGNPYKTIQHVWDNVIPWYVNHIITIQLLDGTYTLTSNIELTGKTGKGKVNIQGNSSDRTQVVIDGDNHTYKINIATFVYIAIEHLKTYKIRNINIRSRPPFWTQLGHYIHNCVLDSGLYGIHLNGGGAYVYDCDITNNTYDAIYVADAGYVRSRSNTSTVTNGRYGLYARMQGLIAKEDSTQPTGSTANEHTANGGEIE